LRLNKASQGEATVGKLVNLLSNDVNRFDLGFNFIPFIFSGPIQFLIFLYFLWDTIGIACFASVGFVLLLLPLQCKCPIKITLLSQRIELRSTFSFSIMLFIVVSGRYAAKFRRKIARRTDERGGLMSEIIVGMRVIKMYGWEKPFTLLIDKTRK
jgi:ATP-binding cassette subfamily C (CFTR/MRP) protein 4